MIARCAGIVAATVLCGLGALHAYWAGGGRWGAQVAIPRRSSGEATFVPGSTGTLTVSILLFGGAGVARAPGAMGTVAAALVVRRRRMGAGRGLRRARGRRPAMVRVIQTNQGNPLRAVGHHALRPAVRTTRAGILAGGCRGAVNGSRGLTARPLDEQGPLRNS